MTDSAAPYVNCPHCGTRNRSDETTCYACKKPLDAPPAMDAGGSEHAPAAAYQVTCPSCQRRARLTADVYRRVKSGESGVRCARCHAALDISNAEPESVNAAVASATVSSFRPESSGLHGLGWLLVIVGGIGLLVAFFMETSVVSTSSYGGYGTDRVHNLGLLARQMVVSIASGMTLVAGAVFVGVAYLSDLREAAWRR